MNAPLRIPGKPAPIGDNVPPEPTPFDLSRDEIEGLFAEASHWLDGSGVQSQADADAVGKLLDMLGDAIKRADARRKDENKPFDDGKAEVQARYNTLIGGTKSVTGRAILAQDACRKALTPWRLRQDEERRAAAEKARQEADEQRRLAEAEFQTSPVDDLEARARAEDVARGAKAAEAMARRAEKPHATGLRTTARAEVTDFQAFARWAWTERPDELCGLLQTLAERLCAARVRAMPGVVLHEERVAR